MAEVLKGDFGGENGPSEPSGWQGYDDVSDKVHQYTFAGSNIHKIVVTTDAPAPSRTPRSTKSKPTPAPQEADNPTTPNMPTPPNAAPAKDRFEFTMPVILEPAFRCAASVARDQLIEEPVQLKEMVDAITLIAHSPGWRAFLGILYNENASVRKSCFSACRSLIKLVQAKEDEALRRAVWFTLRLENDPKGTTAWYEKAKAYVMPSIGDTILDATSFRGRLVRWMARKAFPHYKWERNMQLRAERRAKEKEAAGTSGSAPA